MEGESGWGGAGGRGGIEGVLTFSRWDDGGVEWGLGRSDTYECELEDQPRCCGVCKFRYSR